MKDIKGIFFDLGGTLFLYESKRKRSHQALTEAIASLADGKRLEEAHIHRAYADAHEAIAQRYAELDYYLHTDLFRDIFLHATHTLGVGFDDDVYARYWQEHFLDVVDDLTLKEDCRETLSVLRDAGLYLSIVSNIDEDMLHPLVEREGLHDYLHHWTSSEAAQSCKPHSRFFEVSLEKSGLQAGEVLFVGDSPEHDINGASAVGMKTVLVRNGDTPAPLQAGAPTVEPDFTIHQLNELIDIAGIRAGVRA